MKTAIKMIIYIIFVLGILLGGLEVVRITKFQLDFEEDIRIMLEDSLELSIDDTLRYSHITHITDTGTQPKDIFLDILEKKYNVEEDTGHSIAGVDYIYKAKRAESFFKGIEFEEIRLVSRGEYDPVGDNHVQTSYPQIVAKGEIILEPLVLLVDVDFKLPFNVEVGFVGHSDYN